MPFLSNISSVSATNICTNRAKYKPFNCHREGCEDILNVNGFPVAYSTGKLIHDCAGVYKQWEFLPEVSKELQEVIEEMLTDFYEECEKEKNKEREDYSREVLRSLKK